MNINKDKLKIKYILKTYKNNNNYPTVEDLIYQVINYCHVNNIDNIISDINLKKVFNTNNIDKILNIL